MDTQNRNNHDRNYGIDFLRIISMIMISMHHVLVHGGILDSAIPLSLQYQTSWFIEIAAFCGVNIYGIISGYVGYKNKHRISKFLFLYFQVVFYTLVTSASFVIFQPKEVTGETILNSIFPFAYNVYWYYSAYFCLFFLMPFLDRLIEVTERKELNKLMLVLFLIFSVLQVVFDQQFAMTNNGYCFLWLAIMYLVGAYIKKYDIGDKDRKKYIAGYLLCILFVWLTKMGIESLQGLLFHRYVAFNQLVNYTSPFIILSALFLLLLFKTLKYGTGMRKIISFFSIVSFDVYLFHEEPLLREAFIKDSFTGFLVLNPAHMIFLVISVALLIWLVGSIIGWIRVLIFRAFRIERICDWIESHLRSI